LQLLVWRLQGFSQLYRVVKSVSKHDGMLPTSPVALMRRGCVTTMLQAPPAPPATACSSMNCGTCVDLPHPAI